MRQKSLLNKITANFLLVGVLLFTAVSNLDLQHHANLIYNGQASLETTLIAVANKSQTTYPTDDQNIDGLLYGDQPAESLDSVDDFIDPQTKAKLLDPTQIPAQKQPIIDRSNPDNKLLEKTAQMFDDSGVLSDD